MRDGFHDNFIIRRTFSRMEARTGRQKRQIRKSRAYSFADAVPSNPHVWWNYVGRTMVQKQSAQERTMQGRSMKFVTLRRQVKVRSSQFSFSRGVTSAAQLSQNFPVVKVSRQVALGASLTSTRARNYTAKSSDKHECALVLSRPTCVNAKRPAIATAKFFH